MLKCLLKINLENSAVLALNRANQKITIVKSVEKAAGLALAWVSFSPFEQNEVSWEPKYAVYASTCTAQSGTTIYRASAVDPATVGAVYPFEYGTFSAPKENDSVPHAYSILNSHESISTFGLAQSVSVNGTSHQANPLNAVTVMLGQKASFAPVEKVQVFMEANFDNGMVVSEVVSLPCEVDFTTNKTQTIRYDERVGRFIPA